MLDKRINGIKISLNSASPVKVEWKKTVIRQPVGFAPELKTLSPDKSIGEVSSWTNEIEAAGFTRLDYCCELERDKAVAETRFAFSLDFEMELETLPDKESQEIFLVVVENENGKIISIRMSDKAGLPASAPETGMLESRALFSLSGFSHAVITVFKKTIKVFKGAWRAISQWDSVLKKKLYQLSDKALFMPANGFGLKSLNENGQARLMNAGEYGEMASGRSLLFIHGIFSEVEAAFKKLAIPVLGDGFGSILHQLHQHYQNRIYGFDHPTFSKSTLENALDLVDKLPVNAELDLICHSRGGQVTRCLLEHPLVSEARDAKNIIFANVLFVAGACQGSPLASDEFLDDFLMVTTGLKLIPSVKILAQLLEVVAKFAHNAPGVICLDPKAQLSQDLDANTQNNPAQTLAFCRANYDPDSRPLNILDEVIFDLSAFNGKANDFVVPYAGANIGKSYSASDSLTILPGVNFGGPNTVQNSVYHLNYFEQPKIQELILQMFV